MDKKNAKTISCVLFVLAALLLINDLSVYLSYIDITWETILLAFSLVVFAASMWLDKKIISITALFTGALAEIIAGIIVIDYWTYAPYGQYLLAVGISVLILLSALFMKDKASIISYIAAGVRMVGFILLAVQWGFSLLFFLSSVIMSAAIAFWGIHVTVPKVSRGVAVKTSGETTNKTAETLRKLFELKQKGIITPEEYDAKKKELLNQ